MDKFAHFYKIFLYLNTLFILFDLDQSMCVYLTVGLQGVREKMDFSLAVHSKVCPGMENSINNSLFLLVTQIVCLQIEFF